MFDESPKSILNRLAALTELDMSACTALSSACILVHDEESAYAILDRIRSHINLAKDKSRMYDSEFYLEYVKDLVDMLKSMSELGGPLPEMYETARDYYEVLLYNRTMLTETLYQMRREDDLDGLRENYWMN